MDKAFKAKKKFALFVSLTAALSALYMYYFTGYTPPLTVETFITADKPTLEKSKSSKATYYSLNFTFINHYNTTYKLSDAAAKYLLYPEYVRDIAAYDTVVAEVDENNNIYSLSVNRAYYVDDNKVQQWYKGNYRFQLFCRVVICVACLPILFFKQQPTFWHSGFEFVFEFTYLFFGIFVVAICVYFYYNGTEYLNGFDPATLTQRRW